MTHWYTTCVLPRKDVVGGPKWYDWSHIDGEWKDRNADCLPSGIPKYARSREWLEARLDNIDKLRIVLYDQRITKQIWEDERDQRQAAIAQHRQMVAEIGDSDGEIEGEREAEKVANGKNKKRKTANYSSAPRRKRGAKSKRLTNDSKAGGKLTKAKKRAREEIEDAENEPRDARHARDIPGSPSRKMPRLQCELDSGPSIRVDRSFERGSQEEKRTSLIAKIQIADKGFLKNLSHTLDLSVTSPKELRQEGSPPSTTANMDHGKGIQNHVETFANTQQIQKAERSRSKSAIPDSVAEKDSRSGNREKSREETKEESGGGNNKESGRGSKEESGRGNKEESGRGNATTISPLMQWYQVGHNSPKPERTESVKQSGAATGPGGQPRGNEADYQPRRSGRQRTKKRHFGDFEDTEDTMEASRVPKPKKSRKMSQRASLREESGNRSTTVGIIAQDDMTKPQKKKLKKVAETQLEVPETPDNVQLEIFKNFPESQPESMGALKGRGQEAGADSVDNQLQYPDTPDVMDQEPRSTLERKLPSVIDETDYSGERNASPLKQSTQDNVPPSPSARRAQTDENTDLANKENILPKDRSNSETIRATPTVYAGRKRKVSSMADESDSAKHLRSSVSHSARVSALTQGLDRDAARDFAMKMKEALAKEKKGQVAEKAGRKKRKIRNE